MAHYQPGFAQVPATRCAGLQVRRRAFAFATGFFVPQRRGCWIRDSISAACLGRRSALERG